MSRREDLRDRLWRFWLRLTRYEFWPYWIFFLPVVPLYIWYAIRLRNPVYFTEANPGIEFGGFFGEKKSEIMREVPRAYQPQSIYVNDNPSPQILAQRIHDEELLFPLVMKPDVGERGDEVAILSNQDQLNERLAGVSYAYLLQEYIDYPIELGVFYARLPSADKGQVMSVVRKKFLSVTGDGNSTVEALLRQKERGCLQLPRLRVEKPLVLKEIPPHGVVRLVEPVGNHCLGTEFINNNHLINNKLNEVFDQISKPFDGFFYGRYDLKINSEEEMYRGERIKIFELNGVTSEPGHIYDRKMRLWQAYRDLWKHQRMVFLISRENLRKHGPSARLIEISKRAFRHFFIGKR